MATTLVRTYARGVITGFAHAAVCVADVEEATRWYSEVIGLRVLATIRDGR